MRKNIDISMLATSTLDRPSGDVFRILSLLSGISKIGGNVNLITPKPYSDFPIKLPSDINVMWLEGYQTSYLQAPNCIRNIYKYSQLNKLIKKLRKNRNSIVQVEHSLIGGYLASMGHKNYILDVHGLVFDEIKYASTPSYIPINLYQKYIYTLEKLGVRNALKVIVVSMPMKRFIMSTWGILEEKIEIIPNGYFEEKVNNCRNINVTKRTVSFIGLLEKWANVDKIIEAANNLRNEDILFYIVGDGSYKEQLEQLARKYALNNIIFTGFVPIDEAYKIMAQSEVLLAPFPKTLALEVACPIKLLEYMALGKNIVVDNVGEVPQMLKDNNAAFVTDPHKDSDFTEGIRVLVDEGTHMKELGQRAKALAGSFTWKKQGERLAKMYNEL
ncbi:MAG: glycosyltransferase family 4 protein [Methanotrichaceae archaeon]|jgi:glycosyltransferase involved in cell wall biosynthesis